MASPIEFIRTIYSKKFDGDNFEEGRKIQWENSQKFIHKLNKQKSAS